MRILGNWRRQAVGAALIVSSLMIVILFSAAQETQTQSATADTMARELLENAHATGGIEISLGCNQSPKLTSRTSAGDLDKSLQSISRSNPTFTWKNQEGLYTIVIQAGASIEVASIKVPKTQIKTRTFSGALDALLRNPQVAGKLSRTGYRQLPERLGYTSVRERQERTIDIPGGRLDDALNLIAKAFGGGIWRIYERNCDGMKVYAIDWLVR